MTGQASDARSTVPVPPWIAEAARRARLGKRRASYPGAQAKGGSAGCFTTGVVVSGVIAVVLVLTGAGGWAIIPVGLVVLALFGRWLDASTSRKNQDLRLDLYEDGLIAVIGGRVHAVRYDTTSVLQEHVRHTGIAGYSTFAYAMSDVDGQTVVLRGRVAGAEDVVQGGRFSNPREWGAAIQRGVTDAQLPNAIATLNAGGRLAFGDLWMTSQEVGSTRASARWPQIDQIKVWDGVVELQVAGARRPVANARVNSVPNIFVFRALAEHLRRSQSGTLGE